MELNNQIITLEKYKAFNDWYFNMNDTFSHLKYQIESNQFPETLNNDLDNLWAEINLHQKDLEDIRNYFKATNITVKDIDVPLIAMTETKNKIDYLRLVKMCNNIY